MTAKSDRTLRQQSANVARLANQLRFELLLLRRRTPRDVAMPDADAREPTLEEIYAAAVLRAAERVLTP